MTRVLTTESWSALQNPLLSSRLIIMRSSLRRGNSTGLNKFSKPHPTTSIPRNSSDLHEFRMSIYSAVVHPWWQRQSFSKIGQSKDSLRFGKTPSHRCWLTPSIAHSPNWPTKCQDTVRPWPIYSMTLGWISRCSKSGQVTDSMANIKAMNSTTGVLSASLVSRCPIAARSDGIRGASLR